MLKTWLTPTLPKRKDLTSADSPRKKSQIGIIFVVMGWVF
jgi:hypothetical protein